MASMLECLTVSCTSALPSTAFSVGASCFSPRRSSAKLLRLSSLKLTPVSTTRSVGSLSFPVKRFNIRGVSIVCEAQNTTVPVEDIGDSEWKQLVLGSESPVMVEFWAPWCGPCRMITPIIDELAKEYAGKLKCYKVNTDVSPAIASQYGIRSIPTVIIFKNGEKKDTIIGAVPKTTLTASIEKFL